MPKFLLALALALIAPAACAKKVLLINTAAPFFKGAPTGIWLEELVRQSDTRI